MTTFRSVQRLCSSILLLFCLAQVIGQRITELPSMMDAVLSESADLPALSLFVKAPESVLIDWEKEGRLDRRGSVDGYRLISISADELGALVATGQLTYIDVLWAKGMPLNDRMLLNNNVLPVHQGVQPIGRSLKGEGVIIGVIDTGVELEHPDFLDEDEETRVLGLWDMTYEFDEEHLSEYGFGSVWTKEQIDDGEAINHHDQPQWFGHGSTVTGSACADGSAIGNFGGVAPLSDMAIVSFDFDRPDFLGLVSLSVQYLIDLADEAQKPLVVNASLGTYYGSHDGLDPTALYIDSLLDTQPGRLMVAAAGNSGDLSPYHLRTAGAGENGFTWFEAENGLGGPGASVFFELWADTLGIHEVLFSMGADQVSADSIAIKSSGGVFSVADCLGGILVDSLFDADGVWLANVEYWAQYRGEQIQMQVFLPQVADPDLLYRFTTSGETYFDVWSTSQFGTSDIRSTGLPSIEDEPSMVDYIAPDKEQHMVSSFSCSDHVITVANYTNRNDYVDFNGQVVNTGAEVAAIASSSSHGPSRVGLQKPDIAASGSIALSAGDFDILATLIATEPFKVAEGGLHHRNGGTSMASPVVAGAAALFLEQCPLSDWQDFRAAVHENGQTDLHTGVVPNVTWGHGKLNTYATIAASSLSVEVTVEGNVLTASEAESYQWFVDDQAIDGATAQTITSASDGVYTVLIEDGQGCTAVSEGIVFTDLIEVNERGVSILNRRDGTIQIDGLQLADRVDIYDIRGRSIYKGYSTGDRMSVDLTAKTIGVVHIVVGREGDHFVEKIIIE